MAERRRYGTRMARSTRTFRKRVDAEVLREEKKTLGRWESVTGQGKFSTTAADKGFTLFQITTGDSEKKLIYAMDTAIGITQAARSISDVQVVTGAIVTFHEREGQGLEDFLGATLGWPNTEEANQKARFRAVIPFAITNNYGGSNADLIIPFRFMRGHQIQLLPNEIFRVYLTLADATPNGLAFSFGVIGRYRSIVKPISG